MAKNDLNDFGKRMRRLATNVQHNTNKLVRRTAVAVDQTVVIGTPVDKGEARSGWHASVNKPGDVRRPAFVLGSKGSTGAQNSTAAIADARHEIAKFDSSQGDVAIFISNLVPHIVPLNAGHSPQAEAGFVEQAVKAGTDAAAKSKVLES